MSRIIIIINVITGAVGLVMWFYLIKTTDHEPVGLAYGILIMLIGFGGVSTIERIIDKIKK